MEKETRALLAVGIGLVLLVLIVFVPLLYLGTFNVGSRAPDSYSGSVNIGSQYGGPTYHVFNYFNSAALMLIFLLGGLVALIIIYQFSAKTQSLLAMLLYIIGCLLLFASITIFLFGVHDLLTFKGVGETYIKPTFTQQYGWIIESVLTAILGSLGVWGGEYVRKREQEEGSLVYLTATPPAAVTALFAIGTFIFGMIGMLAASAYDEAYTYEWILEAGLFGGFAAIAFNKIDAMRLEMGETTHWRRYPLFAAGYAFLFCTLGLLVFSVKGLLEPSNAASFNTGLAMLETAIFAVLGIGSFYLGDWMVKNEDRRTSALYSPLVLLGVMLILFATIAFIAGFDRWIGASITASSYRASFGWIVETALYSLLGFACLRFGDGMKETKVLAFALSFSGALLWIASLWNFVAAVLVYDTSSKYIHPDLLFVKFAVHGIAALLLLVYSDRLKKDGKGLAKTLAYTGIIFVLITLVALLAGVHQMLYDPEANLNWLIKTAAYGIAAAVLLVVGNKMDPLIKPKNKAIAGEVRKAAEGAAPAITTKKLRPK